MKAKAQNQSSVYRGRYPGDPCGTLLGDQHYPLPDRYYAPPKVQLVIHIPDMQPVCAGEYRTAWEFATEAYRPSELAIGEARSPLLYHAFTLDQLHQLYYNLTEEEFEGESGEELINALCQEAGEFDELDTPKELFDPTLYMAKELSKANQPTKAPRAPADTSSFQRPKAGTATGMVWDLADKLLATSPKLGKAEFKEALLKKAVEAGINPATAQVQLGKWRGSKGL